jgi:CheY-like chemotaxis protein
LWGYVTYRILIADDQELVRKMLRTLLEIRTDWKICAEAANGLEAVQKAAELDTLRDVTKLLEFDQLPDQDQQTPQKSEAK